MKFNRGLIYKRKYKTQYQRIFINNILDLYLEDDKKIVTDVALVNVIEDSKIATKELLKSKGNTVVYHTGSEKIVIEVRNSTGLSCMRL